MKDELSEDCRNRIDALLAGKAIAHRIIDDMSADDIQDIVSHPEVTWTVLSLQSDRDAAIRLLEHRFQHLFLSDQNELLLGELESPEMTRDAASEPALEQIAMRAVTGLAWDGPRDAVDVYQRYYTGDLDTGQAESIYGIVHRVLAVAPSWRRLQGECNVPEPLCRFISLQWVVSAQVLDDSIRVLRRDMIANPESYLLACDCMAAQYEALLHYIVSLTERFLPSVLPSLGELAEDERERLDTAMGQIDAPMGKGLRVYQLVAVAGAIGALLSMGGLDALALVAMVVFGISGALYAAWVERGVYGRLVRPPLARYLADVGTPTQCIVSWLLVNQKTVKRIKSFDIAIDGDSSLYVLARLGRMSRLRDEPFAS